MFLWPDDSKNGMQCQDSGFSRPRPILCQTSKRKWAMGIEILKSIVYNEKQFDSFR